VTDWAAHARREQERYRDGEERLPDDGDQDARQRQLTRMGNAASGAALSELMGGNTGAAREWFAKAVERYRESYENAPPGSWGRPIAMLKAEILAGDWDAATRDAEWTLEQGAADAESPIGRYAAALALLVLGQYEEVRVLADGLRTHDDFPSAVGDALAMIAAEDVVGYVEAVEAVLESFETREEYLEDLPVADTVLVLQAFAARRGIVAELSSPLLPST
jgi:tetratricopeptide (TPR) repeat protein